eukprot:10780983-Lingulodinium_polyedra.AAC.1
MLGQLPPDCRNRGGPGASSAGFGHGPGVVGGDLQPHGGGWEPVGRVRGGTRAPGELVSTEGGQT